MNKDRDMFYSFGYNTIPMNPPFQNNMMPNNFPPFNDINNLHQETIEIQKDTGDDMDIYIALQGDKDTDFGNIVNKPNLNIVGTNPGGINLYSQAEFNISGSVHDADNIHKT